MFHPRRFSRGHATGVGLLSLLLLNSHSAQAQNTFGNVILGGGGYVTGVLGVPGQQNLFYAKTDVGGAYRWDELNQSWIPLLDWNSQNQTTYQGVESIAVDPQSPNKVYILAGTSYWNGGASAVLRSSDYGATFAITDVTSKFKANGNGPDRQKGETLAVDPNLGNVLFCGSRANGLFKSTDSGATWNAVSSLSVGGTSISFVLFDPQSGSSGTATPRIFVGVFRTGTNLYVSNNGGVSWAPVSNQPTNGYPEKAALSSNNNLYLTYGVDPNGSLWKYNLTNSTWRNCSPSGTLTYCGISVSPQNPDFVVASTYSEWLQQPWGWGDRIYVSSNGGTNWTDIIASGRVTMNPNGFPYIVNHAVHWAGALALDPFNTNRVFIGSGNGIFSTTNLNAGLTTSTWKFMCRGLEETVPITFCSVPNGGPFLNSVGDQNGFVHTDINVSPSLTMSQVRDFAYASKRTNVYAAVYASGECYYSTGPYSGWTKYPSAPNGMTDGYVGMSADGSTVVWRSTMSSTNACYVNTNPATAWIPCAGVTFAASPKGDSENSSKFYAYNSSDGYVYVSTNGGFNFYRSGSAGTGGSLRVAPGFEGHVWVSLGTGGVKYSTNSGATFYSGNLNVCDALAFGKAAPGASYPTLFIWGRPTSGSATGMYRSNDRGATWVRVNDDQHQYGGRGNAGLIEGDKNVHGRVYMSSAGRGVIWMSSSVAVTNIGVAPDSVSTNPGAVFQLTATVAPANATYPSVTWSTADPNVATVDSSGLVTAVAAGSATVSATTLDGGLVSGCVVTVSNPVQIPPPLGVSISGDLSTLTLSWPELYAGWILQVQTNAPGEGLGTNWVTVPDSDGTNQMSVPIDPSVGSVFYRLMSP
ncbi:MAG: Ig-like domain-containing protein [Verrucomicrobiota bacterium]